MPPVYGPYEPEPLLDSCFNTIAKACDHELFEVLTNDLDALDVSDADVVSLDELMEVAA